MPVKIRFEYTKYPHWGNRSGYVQLINHLSPKRISWEVHGTPQNDTKNCLPSQWIPFGQSLRSLVGRHGKMPWYKFVGLNAEIAAMESCLAGRVDVIHFMDGEQVGQFVPRAIKAAGLSQIRTVGSFHQPPEVAMEVVNGDLLRWFDAIVLVSPSQLPFFKKFVPEERLHVLLHGVDVDYFRPSKTPHHAKQIHCITTGHNYRDWEAFRKVASALRDIAFDVVTNQDYDFGHLPNVNFYRGISDNKLAKLYRDADILFLPLIKSTANNTLLEGMASGLPVVTTDLEGVRAYLPNDEAILVDHSDYKGFINALRSLQKDSELRNQMGRRARTRAEELSWSRLADRLETFYHQLMMRAPADDSVNRLQMSRWMKASSDWPASKSERSWQIAKSSRGFTIDNIVSDYTLRDECVRKTRVLEKLFPLFSNNYRSHLVLAKAAERQWIWTEAIKQWDRCIELAPGKLRVEAIVRKARCLIQVGRIDQARALFMAIRHNNCEGLAGLAKIAEMEGSHDIAATYWEWSTRQFPDQLAGFLGKANALLNQARYSEAEALLDYTMSAWPKSKCAAILSARCQAAVGNWEAANERWKTILRKDVGDSDVLKGYARYVATSAAPPTLDSYSVTLEKFPTARMEFLLQSHVAQKNYDAAIKLAHKQVARAKQDPLPRLRLAVLLMCSSSNKALGESIALLRKLHDYSPDSILIKVYLINAYIRADDTKKAIRLLQTISAEDKRAEVQVLRMWSRSRNNRTMTQRWRTIFFDFELFKWSESFSMILGT